MSERALLMTDVVDSTACSQRIGEAATRVLWRTHDRVARELLRRWQGRELDKSDGFVLLFDHAAHAVGYALDYHEALARLEVPLQARAGLHVGNVSVIENSREEVSHGAKPLEYEGHMTKSLASRAMSVARGGQTLLTAAAHADLGSTDLPSCCHGHWQVKGVDEPVELFEVARDALRLAAPADGEKAWRVVLRDGQWTPLRDLRHSLPAERDAFVGRAAALRELRLRFDAGARQVTLTGMGGMGKTRLAQRFGWSRRGERPGGVWFCDLAAARSLDGIAHAVAEGLGIPLVKADPLTQLGDALAGHGACLLILDNFEQVAGLAEVTVGRWLERCPAMQVLVTSRSLLGIRGEEVLELEPLPVEEAAELFVRRARAAPAYRPSAADESAVAPLVRLLDGLPLAIELAAARVLVMPPRTLLQRMGERFSLLVSGGGRPDRQATLRAAFDWSWDLLSPREREAFAQVSVFQGGFGLAAAEAVLHGPASEETLAPLDLLQSLVEKSLVRRVGPERFDLLVSVREYAAGHLAREGSFEGSGPAALAAAQARHCVHYAGLVDHAPLEVLCEDLENLVGACLNASALGDGESALGALRGAWSAIELRGPFRLGIELAARVRAVQGLGERAAAWADWVAGCALKRCGRVAEARESYESALLAARRWQDLTLEAEVLVHLGDLHVNEGRFEAAQPELEQALALARSRGRHRLECEALTCLGNLREHQGRMAEARLHYEGALAAARAAGHRRWEGGSLGNLGLLCANTGRMAEAREHYEAAIDIACEVGDRQWEGNTRCNLGLLHHVQQQMEPAREQLARSLQIARELGHRRLECIVQCNLGLVWEALGQPEQALAQYEGALGIARDLGDVRSSGQFLTCLGALHARQARFELSAQCLAESEQQLASLDDRLSLGLLWCARAEAEHLRGRADAARAALEMALALGGQVGAEPGSELGLALRRMQDLVAVPASIGQPASC